MRLFKNKTGSRLAARGSRRQCPALSRSATIILMDTTLEALTADIRAFRDARDWLQFHNPKELAVAIAAEAGEL